MKIELDDLDDYVFTRYLLGEETDINKVESEYIRDYYIEVRKEKLKKIIKKTNEKKHH